MSTDIKGNRFLLIFLVCRRTTMLHVTILDKITFITQQSVSSKPVPVISYLLTYPRLLGSKQSPGRGRGRGMELVPTDQECPSWVALLSTRSSSKQNTKMDEAEGKRRQGSGSIPVLGIGWYWWRRVREWRAQAPAVPRSRRLGSEWLVSKPELQLQEGRGKTGPRGEHQDTLPWRPGSKLSIVR